MFEWMTQQQVFYDYIDRFLFFPLIFIQVVILLDYLFYYF